MGATGLEAVTPTPQAKTGIPLTTILPHPLACSLARESQKVRETAWATDTQPHPLDPDLGRLVQIWPALAEPIRRAILAIIQSHK
jgi:hypothetical protein